MNIFQSVKANVSAKEAAEMYGLKVNSNGMVLCPFHDDHHPSLQIGNGFRCFACQERGDVITFVAKLFDLSPLEAAKKLAEDFHVDMYDCNEGGAVPTKNYRYLENLFFTTYFNYFTALEKWIKRNSPSLDEAGMPELLMLACQKRDYAFYVFNDIFITGPREMRRGFIDSHMIELDKIGRELLKLECTGGIDLMPDSSE